MRGNRYLRDYRARKMRDMRSRGREDMRDMRDMRRPRNRDYYPYEKYDEYEDMRDMRDYNDMGRDYGDMDMEYKEDLEQWCKKLKRYDKFKIDKNEIISQAERMGVKFDEFNEDEYVTTFYMMQSDYPEISNQYQTYLAMAKQFLEDPDAELQGSEKLCAYLYTIVKGE